MRCTNCGWENPDGAQRCEKCNSPLAVEPIPEQREEGNSDSIKSTVREIERPIEVHQKDNLCPDCGFPLREGASRCPNCGKVFSSVSSEPVGVPFVAPTPTSGRPSRYDSTINPWSNPTQGKTFQLKPVAWENEQGELPSMNYSGVLIELKRDNTDPTNNTITSKTQAEISNENGKWFIEDKSAQQSTFIHAGRKIELSDGDVIILGNRRFVFKVTS